MAKAGYDADYKPYLALMRAGRLIDSGLPAEDRPLLGIKYSCFDDLDSQENIEPGCPSPMSAGLADPGA